MKIGRNAPCPCGSGKKYKACCLKLDRANRGPAGGVPGGAPIREVAARARAWQADLLPMPTYFEDDPGARPATVLVVAEGFVIHSEVLARPSAEVDDIAANLQRGVADAVAQIGAVPAAVEVREPEVAAVLTRLLRDAGTPITAKAAPLAQLEEAMASLNQSMGAPPTAFAAAQPETWAGWGQPDAWVAEVFRLSAAFHRARPWRHFDNYPPVAAAAPSSQLWHLSVLGGGEVEYGLAFYSEPHDLDRLLDEDLAPPDGRVLCLLFEEGRKLPRAMRHEVARAGWEVAAADAYPTLMTIRTPAGGLRRADADDLTAVLAAMTAWTEAIDADRRVLSQGPWRDPETGVVLEDLGEGVAEEPVYPVLTLEPGGAEGPGARPEAALERPRLEERKPMPVGGELLDRFAARLAGEGLSGKTVNVHVRNAEMFLEYLANWAVMPLAAVHEYDLRTFLFDWYPRKVLTSKTEAARVPVSLRRLFDFLHAEEGISCPWAAPLLKDKAAFKARWDASPGGCWWDQDTVDWRHDHFEELDRRVMSPSLEVPGVLTWGAQQSWVEAELDDELQRHWLVWRDELIRSGLEASDEVRAVLRQREAKWLTTPHAHCDGRTPADAIVAERAETARHMEEMEKKRRS